MKQLVCMVAALMISGCGGGNGDNTAAKGASVQPMVAPNSSVVFFKCEGSGTDKVVGPNLGNSSEPVRDELINLRIDVSKKILQFGSKQKWFDLCDANDKCTAKFDDREFDYTVSSHEHGHGKYTKLDSRWVITRSDGSYTHDEGNETRQNGRLKISRRVFTRGVCTVVPEQGADA